MLLQRLFPGPPHSRGHGLQPSQGDKRHERDLVNILDGNTFVVSDTRGDIEASPEDTTGLFSFDTRFLSKWVLTIDGQRLNPLSVDELHYFESRFFLVPGTGTIYVNATLSVIRQRAVGTASTRSSRFSTTTMKPSTSTSRIDAGSDFADLFEIKDANGKKGKYYHRIDKTSIVARVPAGDVPARDDDIVHGAGRARRGRASVLAPRSARTAAGRRTGRGRPRSSVGGRSTTSRSTDGRDARPAEHAHGP